MVSERGTVITKVRYMMWISYKRVERIRMEAK
jgi:hypothetical protein